MLRFIKNLSAVILLAITMQVLFTSGGNTRRNQPEAIANFKESIAKKPQIIYLGDSTNFVGKNSEEDKRRIDQLLQEKLSNKRVGSIFHAGYHTTIFKSYIDAIISLKVRPELIIIPINMRTITNTMSQVPMFQFEEETFYLENIKLAFVINTFWKMIQGFDIFKSNKLSDAEFNNLPILLGKQPITTVGELPKDYSQESMRLRIINSYLSTIDNCLIRIQSIKDIINMTKESGIKVLFYITPIDIEVIEKYNSKEDIKFLKENIAFIENIFKSTNTAFINMAFDIPSNHFAWPDDIYPNEHLDAFGRNHIATQLAKNL